MRGVFLALLLLSAACGAPADHAAASPAVVADDPDAFAASLLSTLTVTPDGALAFRDEARARQLLGKDFAEASREMDLLNRSIADGLVPPFRDEAALLDYEVVLDADELSPGDDRLSASSRCRGSCLSGMCCVSGWWIFCWGYGTC